MLFMNHTKGIEIIFFKLLGYEEMGRVLKDGGRHSQHPPPAMIKVQEPQALLSQGCAQSSVEKSDHTRGSKPQRTATAEDRRASWDRANLRMNRPPANA